MQSSISAGVIAGRLKAQTPAVEQAAARTRGEYLGVLAVLGQLVLAALVLVHLDMQTSAFRRVFYLACSAFVINHFLPARFRLSFFVSLCGAALLLVMGGSPDTFWDARLAIERSVPIVLIGSALIGICLLPINFWLRAALLGMAGGVMALFRANVIELDALSVIWPVLAAMFMFRVIVYLYDVSTSKQRPKLSESLSYFFIFPNSCLALFPVIDFKTFCRSRYDGAALAIYQRGVSWIVRGIVQLMIYRLVHQLIAIPPGDITNGTELIQFILASTFVYVQVSGQFHLIIGMLLLFGFNLPETNRRYFLAASFTDYWRRVNIYWKDFIMKVVYYPTFFRLKSRGTTSALVIATLWAFFITWALHLYQTWWVKGSAAFSSSDALFWGTLAVLVLANSLWEMKRGRQRQLGTSHYTLRSAAGVVLRTGATFAVITILWSLWSTSSVGQWAALWGHADWHTLGWGLAAVGGVMVATVFMEILPSGAGANASKAAPAAVSVGAIAWWTARSAAPLAVILLLASDGFQSRVNHALIQPWHDAINTTDSMMDRLVTRNRGYYEQLTSADRANAQLWETLMRQRLAYTYAGADPIQPVSDYRFRELKPNISMAAYDTYMQTNRWSMRDGDYSLETPPRTLRIAVLGSSHVMGWGVEQSKVFATVVEDRLNAHPPAGIDSVRYEVLNFAANGLSPLGEISMLQQRVAAFHPDIVLLFTHTSDYDWVNRDLPRSLRQRIPIPHEFIRETLSQARITARTHEIIAAERLKPYEPAVIAWCYARIAEQCAELGAVAAGVFLPVPDDLPLKPDLAANQTALIRQSGLHLIDYTHLYDGEDPRDLQLDEGWHHTNALGHAIVADALYKTLLNDPRIELVSRARRVAARATADPAVNDASTIRPSMN